jgi:Methyltransferase FkbM domain
VNQRIRVQVQSLASVVDEMDLATTLPRTLLKSDTQGHELAVLNGLGDYLEKIKLIQCEISSVPLYDGMPFMTDVIGFLDRHHFKAVSFAPVNSDSVRPAEFDYLCVNEKVLS